MTVATINEVNRSLLQRVQTTGTFTPNVRVQLVHSDYHRVIWPLAENRVASAESQIVEELQSWDAASDEVWDSI